MLLPPQQRGRGIYNRHMLNRATFCISTALFRNENNMQRFQIEEEDQGEE